MEAVGVAVKDWTNRWEVEHSRLQDRVGGWSRRLLCLLALVEGVVAVAILCPVKA